MLLVQVSNYTNKPITDRIKFRLAENWQEQVESQLNWWGGIVNLKTTNKIPPQKKYFPELIAVDLQSALGSLGELTGETTTEVYYPFFRLNRSKFSLYL